jgi:type III secretion system FlhB-like substrate exporter/AAA+ superfamily predicted ATPase
MTMMLNNIFNGLIRMGRIIGREGRVKFFRQLFSEKRNSKFHEQSDFKREMIRYIAITTAKADAVVTDKKKYAIAFKYKEQDTAPRIVAKGKDDVALTILRLSKENSVFTEEQKSLARSLYKEVDVGDTVPRIYWEDVAVIFAKAYSYNKKRKKRKNREETLKNNPKAETVFLSRSPDPITLEIGEYLVPLADKEKGALLCGRISQIRRELSLALGLVIPPVRIIPKQQLEPAEYRIAINEINAGRGRLNVDSPFCANPEDSALADPRSTVAACLSVISDHVTELIKKHAVFFLNRDVIQDMLEAVKKENPIVVKEVKKELPLRIIVKVFKNLLQEQVSIRNIPAVLEALADFGGITQDERFLTEKSRQALARQICLQYADKEMLLRVLTLAPALEERIIAGKTETSFGTTVSLEPPVQDAWIEALARSVAEVKARGLIPVILCSEAARFLVKASVEQKFPELAVLSVPEIPPDVAVEEAGVISLPDDVLIRDKDSDPWAQLEAMIGLGEVKQKLLEIRRFVSRRGKDSLPSLHMVFRGNPGTGKTTVARLIGKIFAHDGVISSSDIFIETDRAGLIGKYVGHTAKNTAKRVNEALGGVLFIDEAYSLLGTTNDFGPECLATLVKRMEDRQKEFVCIMAGYTKEMNAMLKMNPGLRERVQFYIDFPDYSANELVTIFKDFCVKDHLVLDKSAEEALLPWFNKVVEAKGEHFANARVAKKLFERVQIQQALRGKDDIINLEDMERAGESADIVELLERKKGIGF